MTPRLRAAPPFLAALAVAALSLVVLPAGAGKAQSLFAPAIFVNDSAITRYELQQRARMLTLFRAPGNPQDLAREQLIEERVKLEAARNMGLSITDEGLRAGMEEFASRGNLSADEMTQALAQAGVSEQSFRDFVRAGITWREVTRARFAGQVSVSEEELDRATRALTGSSPVRVLLSEIILPARSPEEADAQQRLAARIIANADSAAEFAAFAREYSAAPTASQGGRLGWQAVSELPQALRRVALGLAPGEVSDPLPIENGLALVYLRDIREGEAPRPDYAAIEYATYTIPGLRGEQARARAAELRARVDTCDDLYGVAVDQPPELLDRTSRAPGEIPDRIAAALSILDQGETALIAGDDGETVALLMLCGRTPALDTEAPTVEDLTGFIRNQRIQSLADGYLQQLMAEARIVEN